MINEIAILEGVSAEGEQIRATVELEEEPTKTDQGMQFKISVKTKVELYDHIRSRCVKWKIVKTAPSVPYWIVEAKAMT